MRRQERKTLCRRSLKTLTGSLQLSMWQLDLDPAKVYDWNFDNKYCTFTIVWIICMLTSKTLKWYISWHNCWNNKVQNGGSEILLTGARVACGGICCRRGRHCRIVSSNPRWSVKCLHIYHSSLLLLPPSAPCLFHTVGNRIENQSCTPTGSHQFAY